MTTCTRVNVHMDAVYSQRELRMEQVQPDRITQRGFHTDAFYTKGSSLAGG